MTETTGNMIPAISEPVQAVMPVSVYQGLDAILSKGPSLSANDEEFALAISKSVDSGLIDPVIAEIKAKSKKPKIKHLIVYCACFAILGLIAYCLFPRIVRTKVADAWDLDTEPKSYESEKLLRDSLISDLAPGKANEPPLKMSEKQATDALKYRTINVRKCQSDYGKGYAEYIANLDKLACHYNDLILKECYIEAVLKSFPWDESAIGLARYAKEIKENGDSRYAERDTQLQKAIGYCNYILESILNDKDAKKKMLCIKQQKAQLLMYRWLVENLKKKKGSKVGHFADDEGGNGVNFREDAVKIIREDLATTEEGTKLYNQCIDILIDDDLWCNRIYFGGEVYWRKFRLKNKKYK